MNSFINLTIRIICLLAVSSTLHAQSFLDPSFGTAGQFIKHIGATVDGGIKCIDTLPGNRLVAYGWYSRSDFSSREFLVVLKNNGAFDASFGSNGKYILPNTGLLTQGPSTFTMINSLLVQADGKVLLGAVYDSAILFSEEKFMLVRVKEDGTSLDSSFGIDGAVLSDLNPQAIWADNTLTCMALQSDGKIIAGGQTYKSQSEEAIGLIRYLNNGVIDSSFGEYGVVITNIGSYSAELKAIHIMPDGKIIAMGHADGSFLIMKYLQNGMPDSTFNYTGIKHLTENNIGYGLLRDGKVQSDGKIVLTGGSSISSDGFYVVRLSVDGTPDTTFNHTGEQTVLLPDGLRGTHLNIQTDGKIIVQGDNSNEHPGGRFIIARLSADGQLDATFGKAGLIDMDSIGLAFNNEISDVRCRADGKILVAGVYFNGGAVNSQKMLIRLNPDNTTGISETAELYHDCEIYPNPAKDRVFIKIPESFDEPLDIIIYDVQGKVIKTNPIDQRHESNEIDVTSFSAGIYTIELKNDNGITYRASFIKQ